MRYIKYLFAIFLISVSLIAMGQNAEQGGDPRSFTVGGRTITVKGGDWIMREEIEDTLRRHGARVKTDFFSRMFLPSITLREVVEIEGQHTAFSISVGTSRVVIRYTSAEMLRESVDELYSLFEKPYGQRIIEPQSGVYSAVESEESINVNDAGVFDGVTAKRSSVEVMAAIDAISGGRSPQGFIFAVANSELFRVDFEVLDGINSERDGLAVSEKYSDKEVAAFVNYATESGVEFIPAIDILSQNEVLEDYIGHSMYSPEGMRFIRAIIEECASKWGIGELCVGRESKSTAPPYYVEFLYEIGRRCDVKIIILSN